MNMKFLCVFRGIGPDGRGTSAVALGATGLGFEFWYHGDKKIQSARGRYYRADTHTPQECIRGDKPAIKKNPKENGARSYWESKSIRKTGSANKAMLPSLLLLLGLSSDSLVAMEGIVLQT
ncbi:hypothetical protein CDAR_450791 [Caerostris darwini]|uniref:Uncharacterized protein n=1 Tax=Caerostris darwini TaxID=1538125 RepID=A0AAV4W009_9ARAC|nr:hypothetical protein CDAR_450791 [Caerostris darwini]